MSDALHEASVNALATQPLVADVAHGARPLTRPARQGPVARAIKRLLDIVTAALALSLSAPFLLIGMIAIKVSSRGPIFYRSKRLGLGGRPFVMYKLRSMRVGLDTLDRRLTEAEDDRLTTAGKWLRKFKLDELPQFWNVLRGDMSIVGPRPEDWDIAQRHFPAAHMHIVEVRPGIASPVDVDWYPDLTYYDPPLKGVSIQDHYIKRHLQFQLAEKIRYVEQQSLWLDLQVFLRLIFCVFVRSWLPPRKQALPPVQGFECWGLSGNNQ